MQIKDDIEEAWEIIHPMRKYRAIKDLSDRVKALAHDLWVERGSPIGDPLVDWNGALQRLSPDVKELDQPDLWVAPGWYGSGPQQRTLVKVPKGFGDSLDLKFSISGITEACTITRFDFYLTETGGLAVYAKVLGDALALLPGYSVDIELTLTREKSPKLFEMLAVTIIGSIDTIP